MLNSLFILVGAFVGAGFASGKEIFNFFTVYNLNGIISIFIFNFLIFFIFYKILNIRLKYNLENYSDFLELLYNKYSFFNNKIFLFIINIFLATVFYLMIVALCTLFNYQFGIAKIIINIIIILFCYNIFYKNNLNFICYFNTLLMPILIIFLIYLSINNININSIIFNNNINNLIKSLFYGLLYFSYNGLVIIPLLFKIKIKNKKNIFLLSLFFSLIIFTLSILINLLLLSNFNYIKNIDLPILAICNKKNSFYSYSYFFIILSAILSTLFSSGYAFISNLNKKNKRIALIIFLSFSFIFQIFSFSNLINILYPFFGLLGLFQIFIVLFY